MRTLVEYGLANAVAASLLAAVTLAIGLIVRPPAVRNALWVLVLVRLLLPPVWTVSFSIPTSEPATEASIVASAKTDSSPEAVIADVEWSAEELADSDVAAGSSITMVGEAPTLATEPSDSLLAFTVAGSLWLAGTVFVFLRSSRRIIRFHRALQDAIPAPESIQRQAAGLARAMSLGSCPDVRLVPGRVSPALWMPGLFVGRAVLIVPAGLLAVLDGNQRAAVLAHELAHLRRGDPWVRWLELIVSGLYWWHPLLWWFRRELRAAEEECCDLRVVAALGERREYATALVETAAFLGESGPVAALASAAGPVRNLQRRVTMIMRATWPAKLTRLGLAAVLGVGGFGLAIGPAVAQDDRPREERRSRDSVDDRKDPPAPLPPRGRDRVDDPPRERGDREPLDKAREAVERARRVVREATEQLRTAEEALARAEGRDLPPREPRPFDREGGRRVDPAAAPPAPPPARPGTPRTPELPPQPRRAGGEPPPAEFRDLQAQIEDLRRALEQMRQELRRERGDRRDPPSGDSKPKDELKRPVREPERP
jgi:beta-lactamase regulating signal transducer with metallopeptidase domain